MQKVVCSPWARHESCWDRLDSGRPGVGVATGTRNQRQISSVRRKLPGAAPGPPGEQCSGKVAPREASASGHQAPPGESWRWVVVDQWLSVPGWLSVQAPRQWCRWLWTEQSC